MIVTSKIENKRLLKGHRYEVQDLWNSGTNQRWIEGKVHLIGFGRYSVDSFTDDNGNPLPKINYSSNTTQNPRFIKFEDCEEGEILICNTEHYKTLTKGLMYKIQSLKSVEFEVKGFNNNKYTRVENSIKFEGINRYFKFNGYSFRKLTPGESREISLSSILNNEEPNIIKTKDIRGIDFSLNKEKVLMETISKTILDKNRHHLSIIDWSCQKIGDKLKIKPDDFNELLNMTLSEILEKLENT